MSDKIEVWPATDLLPGWAIKPVDWAAYHCNGRGLIVKPIIPKPEQDA
jgi:hypothetical protein